MALPQASVDALEKALASGALSVDFPDGGRVTYRSVAELQEAIAYAKNAVSPPATTQSFASFCKD
jgi:hypothetical protein